MMPPNFYYCKAWVEEPQIASKELYEELNLIKDNFQLEKRLDKLQKNALSNSEKHFLKMGLSYDEKQDFIQHFTHRVVKKIKDTLSQDVQNLIKL